MRHSRVTGQKRSATNSYVRLWLLVSAAAIMSPVAAGAAGLILLVLVQLLPVTGQVTRARIVEADTGVVAADSVICSDIGVEILKTGGNAVDSAIATALCQGVTNPGASGIGGGDFMLIRLANGHAVAYNFREQAPLSASESMYAEDPLGKMVGGLAVAVPGEVKGLYQVWKKYGTLPWKSLVGPAIRLAADGFPVAQYLASQIELSLSYILADKGLRDVFAPNGVPLAVGDIHVRKKLAETLTAIAEEGSDAFYHGPIAEALVEDVQAAGGILTLKDLKNYRVKVRKPVVADTWGHTVIGFPPPSSGGPGLILILNILAAFKSVKAIVGDLGVHHIVEAFKHTYAVRSNLADPEFVNITAVVADMLSPEFGALLQKNISDNTTFGPTHYGGKYNRLNEGDEQGTSHLSIVDKDRNAVAMTCTVNYAFGAKFISQRTGILLNNEMDDFATPLDNVTNGPPATPNFIRPKKQPLSTMSPTIVLEKGQVKAVVGGSGGIKILTTVAQVLLKLIAGYDPLSAVTLPRVHHQFLPDVVSYENYTTVTGEIILVPSTTREFLMERGHVLSSSNTGAVSQLIVQDLTGAADLPKKHKRSHKVFFGKLIGVSDVRKDGYPAGY